MAAGAELKEAILEAQVTAALDGLDLGPFLPVETICGGYQAECRRCSQTVWASSKGLLYSLLDGRCNRTVKD
jgi:hypothetical protein